MKENIWHGKSVAAVLFLPSIYLGAVLIAPIFSDVFTWWPNHFRTVPSIYFFLGVAIFSVLFVPIIQTNTKLKFVISVAVVLALFFLVIPFFLEKNERSDFWSVGAFLSPLLLSVGLALQLAFSTFGKDRRVGKNDDLSIFERSILPHLSEKTGAVALGLVHDSQRMRKLAFFALGGVAAVVVLAANVILFAGLITNLDQRGSVTLAALDAAVEQAKSDYEAAFRQHSAAETTPRGSIVALPDGTVGVIPGKAETTLNGENLEDKKQELERAKSLRSITREEFIRASLAKDASGETATQLLIASAVTRFGVTILLLFFAHSLVNLYRYALRMSAAYRAKAFALCIADEDLSQISDLTTALSLDGIQMSGKGEMSLGQLSGLLRSLSSVSKPN